MRLKEIGSFFLILFQICLYQRVYADSAAVKDWLVFLGSMGPSEVPQGGEPCKCCSHSKKLPFLGFCGVETLIMANRSKKVKKITTG